MEEKNMTPVTKNSWTNPSIGVNTGNNNEINELREELQQTRNAELELYSGRDIDLIAEVYGINLEEELRNK